MATHFSHAGLPFPVRGARFTLPVAYLDADGDPTDPTTPDTEISKDAGSYADCVEEVTTITGSNGSGIITLTGAEMDCAIAFIAAKVASGPKNTLATIIPRTLPVVVSGTATAGASGTITLPSGALAIDDFYNGCIVKTTGGTGGGGTGGANNQARVIKDYVGSTKVATIEPNWETTPDNTTTVDVLATDLAVNAFQANVTAIVNSLTAAQNLSRSATGIYRGSVTGSTTTTTLIDSGLTQSGTDHWNGRIVIFTSGSLAYQATDITAFTPASDQLTFTALTAAPSNGDEYVIV